MSFLLESYNVSTMGVEEWYVSCRTFLRKELVPMITYEELFTFVIMLCAVITLVIYAERKK